ncbi:MAG: universal stress protein, partial [Inhella sp.]
MKILVPVDGSAFTKRALAYLAAHEEWLGPQHRYSLLTVVPAVPPRAASVLDKATLKSYYEDSAEKIFKPLRTFAAKQGLKASFVTKVGSAAETIAETATKGNFDLIVLGSHGH